MKEHLRLKKNIFRFRTGSSVPSSSCHLPIQNVCTSSVGPVCGTCIHYIPFSTQSSLSSWPSCDEWDASDHRTRTVCVRNVSVLWRMCVSSLSCTVSLCEGCASCTLFPCRRDFDFDCSNLNVECVLRILQSTL